MIGVAGCAVEVEDGYDGHLNGSVLALRAWHPTGHLRSNLKAAQGAWTAPPSGG